MRHRGLAPDQVNEAARLYGHGWSLARIGQKMGVDPTTVMTKLRGRGTRMRETQGRIRAQAGGSVPNLVRRPC